MLDVGAFLLVHQGIKLKEIHSIVTKMMIIMNDSWLWVCVASRLYLVWHSLFLSHNDVFLSEGLQTLGEEGRLMCLQGCWPHVKPQKRKTIPQFSKSLWMFVLTTVATKFLLLFIQPCVVFIITLQRGQRLLITVHYNGLLWRCSAVLPSGMGLIVETLHVKLQVAVTVKPEIWGQ